MSAGGRSSSRAPSLALARVQDEIPAVNLAAQHDSIREEIGAAVARVLERQDFIQGEETQELERRFGPLHGCAHAVACASGTDALLLSLLALGIGPGDAVLVPALTFFATAAAVARAGATPVFVDIDPRTFNISPTAAEEALQRIPARTLRARAILPVHLYGQCADMDAINALAQRHRLVVIEDAAQAVLAKMGGRSAGSLGAAGCFSFYPTKNLGGAGDGGIITTNDAALAERLRLLRNHGSADRITYARLGLNSRLDTIQGAILLVKLNHLPVWTAARTARAEFYRRAFAAAGLGVGVYPGRDAPIVLPYRAENAEHVYHQFTIRAHRRDALAAHLASRGIGSAIYYPVPLHRQPVFSQSGAECPEAERAASEVLSLPLYPELTQQQQLRVVEAIGEFYRA